MKMSVIHALVVSAIAAVPLSASAQHPLTAEQLTSMVNNTLTPLLAEQQIPGMAVAVVYQGKTYFFNYGTAEIKTQRPVTENTLFELGSVSKTFTGVLGGYAVQTGQVNLNDPVTTYWPELNGSQWKNVNMLNLATYTAGGLPLQLPDAVTDWASMLTYYQHFTPEYAAGTLRNYSNASIGLFGALLVKKGPATFEETMQKQVFQPLHLTHTFITVPAAMQADYAWGYKDGQPVRVSPGMLDAEAYGVKSTAKDMAAFMQANMTPASLPAKNDVLKKAIVTAQSRYFRVGTMYQGLGWEMYNWPVNPQTVIAASANTIALKPQPAEAITPPQTAVPASWVHKTGATNGFGAYVAFIPEEQVGIVMLANKNYPNPVRVEAAYRILQALRG